jgi:hypothetical protein
MVGYGDRVCLICQQVIEDNELRKAKVLPIGAGFGLTMHAACAEQWAFDLETQSKQKQTTERNRAAIQDAIREVRDGTEMKKSYSPYEVKQQFGTIDHSIIKKQLEEE